MSENLSLALDCGGSKVQAVLYDAAFRPIRTARSGSLRGNTTSPELAAAHARDLLEGLGLKKGDVLERICGISDGGAFHKLLRESGITVLQCEGCGELQAGLSAGGITGDGYLALSGTGATLFARYRGNTYGLGGYGAAVSDEGSGYYMGRLAFDAAIRDAEGRGPRTLLTDLIGERLGSGRACFRGGVFSIYSQNEHSPVAYVASCAPLVSRAAKMGDEIAVSILEKTGYALADQLLALQRLEDLPNDLPVTLSGSVWRSDRRLYDRFCATLREGGMTGEIKPPAFEPIVGVILDHYRRGKGEPDAEAMARLAKWYHAFAFEIGE
jgi:N-acetylglucosamine kinase-like BadF-type ATPase